MSYDAPPIVSVIIPSHRPQYRVIAEASVDAQTFGERQMVVNASPLWWREKINATIRSSAGEFFLFLGDDDALLPHCLEKMMHRARQGYDVVVADCETFGEGWTRRATFGDFSREAFQRGNPVWITSLCRRSVFDELGGFDMNQIWFDYDYWWRAFLHGASFGHVPEVLWRHREGHAGKGTDGVDANEARRLLYEKHPTLRSSITIPG